jgi:hypothetical protein
MRCYVSGSSLLSSFLPKLLSSVKALLIRLDRWVR